MNETRRNYTIRYGETPGNEMVAAFQTGVALRENLERVIPLAIDKELVSPGCTPDTVRVTYKDKVLNLQLSVEEQAPEIAEFALLVVMDRAATLSVRFRYKPDHIDEKSEVVGLKPDEVLEGQLKPLLGKIRAEHRFRGFRRKAFRLYEGRRRLSAKKSPAGQGLKSGSEVRVVPSALLGWPPGRFEFSVVAVLVVAGLSYLAYRWWPVIFPPPAPEPIERFHVWFKSDVDCRILAADSLLVQLTGGKPDSVTVKAGVHDMVLLPKGFPVLPYKLDLSPMAESDSAFREITVEKSWKGRAELMELNVYGFYERESTSNRIRANILINGFPYDIDVLGELKLPNVYRGTYDIRYDLPVEDCLWDKTRPGDGRIFRARESEFWFDFSRYDGEHPATIIFFYRRPS